MTEYGQKNPQICRLGKNLRQQFIASPTCSERKCHETLQRYGKKMHEPDQMARFVSENGRLWLKKKP